jgi:hypothetical protein
MPILAPARSETNFAAMAAIVLLSLLAPQA